MAKLRNPESFKASISFPTGNSSDIKVADIFSKRSVPISTPKKNGNNLGATRLPVDDYKEEILRKVKKDRVVIIHGETGCGKSSRIPVRY